MKSNKKKMLLKIIGSSSILTIASVMVILICVLMILDFFCGGITKHKSYDNKVYSNEYINATNYHLRDGYVPLQRILYFYLEDSSLSFETLYELNQDISSKSTKDIYSVCNDDKVKNMVACSSETINKNKDYLSVTDTYFNFPLKIKSYSITSFFEQQRIIFGKEDIHTGWDIAAPAQTPVYSVCSGTVYKVKYTQNNNVPYKQSGNKLGNMMTIKCDQDYQETYYVTYYHLYPKSAKVKVGDKVEHWTEVASVGTTGSSTGNHLHYQVADSNWNLLDGMQFVNFNM